MCLPFVPWTLYYPHRSQVPTDRDVVRIDLDRLRKSKQISSIASRNEGDYLIVEVSFVDESRQTQSRALLRILRERGTAPPSPIIHRPWVPGDLRERLISEALATQTGRARLAASMISPLRTRIDYRSIGRQTFLVQALPEGALPVYDRDPDVARIVTNPCGEVPLGGKPGQTQAFLPDWLKVGAWICSTATNEIAEVRQINDLSVDVSFWHPPNGKPATTWLALSSLGTVWRPIERPRDPMPVWTRLMADEDLYLGVSCQG